MSTTTHEHGPAEVAAAVSSIERERAVQDPPAGGAYAKASTDRKATPAQLYRIARETLELLGLDWPEHRLAASELIGKLSEANAAKRSGADMPF